MKKLRKNSGFTLVECIVAMAVLAVLMVGLLMIMSVIVRQRNDNTTMERNIDNQVEQIVQGNGTAVDLTGGDIDFGGYKISGAQKVYFDDAGDLQIGSLKYDVGSSSYEGDPDGEGNKAPDGEYNGQQNNPLADAKVYGALETTAKNAEGKSTITVTQQSKTDNADGTTTLVWRIDFNVSGTGGSEKSIKIVFPSYGTLVAYTIQAGSECYVHKIGYNTVRFEPKVTDNYSKNPKTVHNQIDVEFIIPTDKYSANLISEYFGSSTPAIND